MPDYRMTIELPYESSTDETSILLARRFLMDAVDDALDADDEAYLAALAGDLFGIKDPEHDVIEEAEHILLGGHWSDSFSDPVQEPLFGAEAWT